MPKDIDFWCDPQDCAIWEHEPHIIHELADACGMRGRSIQLLNEGAWGTCGVGNHYDGSSRSVDGQEVVTVYDQDLMAIVAEHNNLEDSAARWIEVAPEGCSSHFIPPHIRVRAVVEPLSPQQMEQAAQLGGDRFANDEDTSSLKFLHRQYALDTASWAAEHGNMPGADCLEVCDDYLDSLIPEKVQNKKVNLHRHLSNFTGICPESAREKNVIIASQVAGNPTTLGSLLCKVRIPGPITITRDYPEDERGYAVGQSDYGKVYIPEKFRSYIPSVGESVDVTLALQPASEKSSFPLTCIYIH